MENTTSNSGAHLTAQRPWLTSSLSSLLAQAVTGGHSYRFLPRRPAYSRRQEGGVTLMRRTYALFVLLVQLLEGSQRMMAFLGRALPARP